ncbi:NAD(P)/FAD-dependent oxidoreductase [Acetivibrio sp. MSJd-27]|uniref:protoporphyrinogen/coproporphyrinogen oxidase n=1 Tax=Acetivibrio sp. MSJd-27 TaxID=2841523 RepID=UPI001C1104B0|nr:NAD(P)-binding protein [Acetivibrio sp. MSJd-27]MBU5450126.1 FAD-dependent oxidoreductase [Acetivibrio sp. MSJd-27]
MEHIKTKYLILGAGLTGLTFAAHKQEHEYILIEKEKTYGGYCGTHIKNDFVWDYSGHFFHFKTQAVKQMFLDAIPSEDVVEVRKNTKILYNGELIDYPFQKNIHQLPQKEFIDCLYDLYFRKTDWNSENFHEMLYAKFGKSITEKFLKPYNEKLYACELSQLDSDAMGRFFPYADIDDIIKNFKTENNQYYNDTFLYPRKGAQQFIDYLYSQVEREKIYYNEDIVKIDYYNKTLYTKKRKYNYEYLISTIPLNKFAEYLEFPTDQIMSYNKVLTLNIGFHADSTKKFSDIHWLYVPDKKYNFYRIGFYNHIVPASKLSVYVEIGFSPDKNIDISHEFKETLKNMKSIGIIDSNTEVVDWEAVIMDPAYVHINKKTEKLKAILFGEMRKNNIYSIGRYGEWKYCSMEDCIIDALKLGNTI